MTIPPNTQAILLLTAPLLPDMSRDGPRPLSVGQYAKVARVLREQSATPSDLMGPNAAELIASCVEVCQPKRLRALLERGFQLAQSLEQWQSRAIWVISRADPGYPKRLKERLGEQSPPVLYGCGNGDLLTGGGLAIVGPRNADKHLLAFTEEQAQLAAAAGIQVVSGGARGVDHAAMSAAVAAGGHVVGILAEKLERAVTRRDDRDAIMRGRLLLVSPFDPMAGFHVGQAMQRNKLIYLLADGALVVNAELEKGGTWSGAEEMLRRWGHVPLYVRAAEPMPPGMQGLLDRGAREWPSPESGDEFTKAFSAPAGPDPQPEIVRDKGGAYPADENGQGKLFP